MDSNVSVSSELTSKRRRRKGSSRYTTTKKGRFRDGRNAGSGVGGWGRRSLHGLGEETAVIGNVLPCSQESITSNPTANNMNFQLACSVSSTESDLNPCKHQGYICGGFHVFANTDRNAAEQAFLNIGSKLPEYWGCSPHHCGLNVMLLSRGRIKTVQRQVLVYFSGKAEVFVHSKLLPNSHPDLYTLLSDTDIPVLSAGNMDLFCECVLNFVNKVRSLEICVGVVSEEFKSVWKIDNHGYVDSNPYLESRYTSTFRSNECGMLVPPRKWKCSNCCKFQKNLKEKASRHANGIKLCTANIYLTEEEKLKKLSTQQTALKIIRSRLQKLFEKFKTISEAGNSIIDKDIEELLLEIALSNVMKTE